MKDILGDIVAESQRELLGWVPYEFWVRMYPEETRTKIRGRVRSGRWQMGVHVDRPTGSQELWVHLRNAKAWIEGTPYAIEPLSEHIVKTVAAYTPTKPEVTPKKEVPETPPKGTTFDEDSGMTGNDLEEEAAALAPVLPEAQITGIPELPDL